MGVQCQSVEELNQAMLEIELTGVPLHCIGNRRPGSPLEPIFGEDCLVEPEVEEPSVLRFLETGDQLGFVPEFNGEVPTVAGCHRLPPGYCVLPSLALRLLTSGAAAIAEVPGNAHHILCELRVCLEGSL